MSNAVANQAPGQASAKILMGDGATPEVFTAIAEVSKLAGPQLSRATIDVTSIDSNGAMEYIVGLTDSGTVTGTVNYTPSAHEAFRTATTVKNYKIELPGNPTTLGTFAFAGVVTKFDWSFDETKQMVGNFTIQVTGPVTFTAP